MLRFQSTSSWTPAIRALPLASFNDLIGAGEQRLRHGEAKRTGGLAIDREFNFGSLADRHIGGLGSFEILAAQRCALPITRRKAGAVAEKATRLGVFRPL